MTIIVGLTGGIASGKTTICKFLEKQKFPLHDSDSVVKNIYTKPPTALLRVLKKIGLSHSIKNKKINKNIIRDEIFNNKIFSEKDMINCPPGVVILFNSNEISSG